MGAAHRTSTARSRTRRAARKHGASHLPRDREGERGSEPGVRVGVVDFGDAIGVAIERRHTGAALVATAPDLAGQRALRDLETTVRVQIGRELDALVAIERDAAIVIAIVPAVEHELV